MKLPIGIQIYSVRDFAMADLESTLKEISSFGYDGIELAGFYDKTPEEYAKLLEKYNLKAMSAHVSYYEMRDDMKKVIENCKTVGCKYIAIPWLDPDYRMDGIYGNETNEDKYQKTAPDKPPDTPLPAVSANSGIRQTGNRSFSPECRLPCSRRRNSPPHPLPQRRSSGAHA